MASATRDPPALAPSSHLSCLPAWILKLQGLTGSPSGPTPLLPDGIGQEQDPGATAAPLPCVVVLSATQSINTDCVPHALFKPWASATRRDSAFSGRSQGDESARSMAGDVMERLVHCFRLLVRASISEEVTAQG